MRLPVILIVGFWLVGSQAALAQTLEDRLRDQLRQTTLQLREAQDSQGALQAQKAAAEQERDALKKQVADLQAEVAHAKRGGGESDALKQEVGKYKDALAQASQSAQQSQAERDKLATAVTSKDAVLSVCEQKNAGLLKVSREILDRFESVDMGDAIGLSEPVTQLSRVELENLAQDYGDRIYDGKFDPRMVKFPPAQGANTPPSPTQAAKTPAAPPGNTQQSPQPQVQAPAAQPQK